MGGSADKAADVAGAVGDKVGEASDKVSKFDKFRRLFPLFAGPLAQIGGPPQQSPALGPPNIEVVQPQLDQSLFSPSDYERGLRELAKFFGR